MDDDAEIEVQPAGLIGYIIARSAVYPNSPWRMYGSAEDLLAESQRAADAADEWLEEVCGRR